MSKYFSNIDIWNPTTMRIELEMAVAKHNARLERNPTYINPLDKMFKEESRGRFNGEALSSYLDPHGEVPIGSNIWRILSCIRLISDSDSKYTDEDIYLLSLFLDEKASIKINDAIDFCKRDAELRSNSDEEYFTLVYKRLYTLRGQILMTYQNWFSFSERKGLRSASMKDLYVFTLKSIDQSIKSHPKEAWEKMIFKGDNSGLLPSME